MKHQQLAGIDPVEVVVPSTNDELKKLWKEGKHWQRDCSNFWREINNKYPQIERIWLKSRIVGSLLILYGTH